MKVYENKCAFGWEGDNGVGEMLIQQIINGEKTATCSFKILYTDEELQELFSTKGKTVSVIDHKDRVRCNIRVLDIFETTFGSPDPRLVKGEGDGDNVYKFQNDHRHAWEATVHDVPLTNDTILIVELIELVEAAD